MTITIKLKTGNAAFEEPWRESEIARLLQEVADRVSAGGSTYARGNLQDLNGNTVGSVTVTGK